MVPCVPPSPGRGVSTAWTPLCSAVDVALPAGCAISVSTPRSRAAHRGQRRTKGCGAPPQRHTNKTKNAQVRRDMSRRSPRRKQRRATAGGTSPRSVGPNGPARPMPRRACRAPPEIMPSTGASNERLSFHVGGGVTPRRNNNGQTSSLSHWELGFSSSPSCRQSRPPRPTVVSRAVRLRSRPDSSPSPPSFSPWESP